MTKQIKTDAEFTDALFQGMPEVEPSATLRRRLAQIPIENPRESFSFWPFGKLWQPAFGLAALSLLGVLTGEATGPLGSYSSEASIAQPTLGITPPSTNANEPTVLAEADFEEEVDSDEDLDALFQSALFLDFDENEDDGPAWLTQETP